METYGALNLRCKEFFIPVFIQLECCFVFHVYFEWSFKSCENTKERVNEIPEKTIHILSFIFDRTFIAIYFALAFDIHRVILD